MSRPPCLIAAATRVGNTRSGCAGGPAKLAAYLRQYPLAAPLAWHWPPPAAQCVDFFHALAKCCQHSLATGQRPIVVGGDHSIAMGTWAGVQQYLAEQNKTLGLVWVDAHLDAHTHQSSPSQNLHGMPVAALLGSDDEILSACYTAPTLAAKHLVMIGCRSYEPAERERLKQAGVQIFWQRDVERLGMHEVLASASEHLAQCDYWGLSFDLDALDPALFPAVSTAEANGLQPQDLAQLAAFCRQDKVIALEIAEFDPGQDSGQQSLKQLRDFIAAVTQTDP